MTGTDHATVIAISKLESRILFDRMILDPSDELSYKVRNLLRVALRDEPDDRHSRCAPLELSRRQCYRILNGIRDSFNNEFSRSLADKVMDALLEIEAQTSVDEFLGARPMSQPPQHDRTYHDAWRDLHQTSEPETSGPE